MLIIYRIKNMAHQAQLTIDLSRRIGITVQDYGSSAIAESVFSWQYLEPLILIQSTIFVPNNVDCNMGKRFHLFIFFLLPG